MVDVHLKDVDAGTWHGMYVGFCVRKKEMLLYPKPDKESSHDENNVMCTHRCLRFAAVWLVLRGGAQ